MKTDPRVEAKTFPKRSLIIRKGSVVVVVIIITMTNTENLALITRKTVPTDPTALAPDRRRSMTANQPTTAKNLNVVISSL